MRFGFGLLTAITVFILLGASLSFAVGETPQSFTLDGRLFSDSGASSPLLDSSVGLRLRILDQNQSCVLYEELQSNINTANNQGYFTVGVGSSVGSGQRTSGDSGHSMQLVYSNTAGLISGKLLSNGAACSYSPSSGDSRFVQITVLPSTGGSYALAPNMALDSVPNAVVAERAESLQGLYPLNFLQVGSGDLSQTNADFIFNTTNFPILTSLLAGTSPLYLQNSSSAGTVLSVVNGAVGSPQAGSIWFNSASNDLQYYNGTSVQTVFVSGQAASGDLAGSYPNPSLVAVGSAGTYVKVTTDAKGRVVSGQAALSSADITTALTYIPVNKAGDSMAGPLSVVGNVTVSSGNQLVLSNAGNTAGVFLQAPMGIASSYTLSLPTTMGPAGQVLAANGSGGLVWQPSTSGDVTGVTASSPLLSSGGANPNITIQQASAAQSGYLASNDWTTFSAKLASSLASGNIFVGNASNLATAVQMSGDATINNAGVLSLVNVNANPGSAGSATSVPVITTNAKGLITAVSTTTITGVTPGGAASGDLAGTYPNPTLATAGTAGTYFKVTTDTKGRVVSGQATLTSTDVTTGLAYTPVNKAGDSMSGNLNHAANIGDVYTAGSGGNTVTLQGPSGSIASSFSLRLPSTAGTAGYVMATDGSGNLSWQPSTSGDVTGVTASSPLLSSGGANPNITIQQASSAQSGYLSSNDWTTFNAKLTSTLASASIFVGNGSNVATVVQMSGDATINNTGVLSLVNVNANPGSAGSATSVPVITTNAKGLITAVSTTTITGVTPGGAASGDLAGTYPNPTVAKIQGTAVTAIGLVSVGDVPSVATGITGNQAIVANAGGSGLSGVSPGASGNFFKSNGTSWQAAAISSSDIQTAVNNLGVATNNLNSGDIFVGNGGNLATGVTLSGDATINNTGVLTVNGLSGKALSISGLGSGNYLKYNGTNWMNYTPTSTDITNYLAYTPVNKAGDSMSGNLNHAANIGDVYTAGSGGNTVTLQGPSGSIASSFSLRLPSTAGTAGYVMATDGSGNLSWQPSTSGDVTAVNVNLPLINTGTALAPVLGLSTSGDITLNGSSYPVVTKIQNTSISGAGVAANDVALIGAVGLASGQAMVVSGSTVSGITGSAAFPYLRFNGSGFAAGAITSSDIATASAALNNITGSGQLNFIPMYDSVGSLATSVIYQIPGVSGDVGIGLTVPTARLHVYNPFSQPGLTIDQQGIDSSSGVINMTGLASSTSVSTGKILSLQSSGDSWSRAVIYSDGSYSIGSGNSARDIYLHRTGVSTLMIDADRAGGAATVLVPGNVGIGTTSPGASLDVNGSMRLEGSTSGYVGFKAPASIATPVTWILPSGDGSANQVLTTNGSGSLIWTSPAGTGVSMVNVNAPLVTSGPATSPTLSLGLASNDIFVGVNGTATAVLMSGDASINYLGQVTVSGLANKVFSFTALNNGQYLKYNGTNWINYALNSADITGFLGYTPVSSVAVTAPITNSGTASVPNLGLSLSGDVTNMGAQTTIGKINGAPVAGVGLASGDLVQVVGGAIAANQALIAAGSGMGASGVAPGAPGTFMRANSTGQWASSAILSSDISTALAGLGSLSGTGSSGYLPYYSGAAILSNSPLYLSAGNIGLGNTAPGASLDVTGSINSSSLNVVNPGRISNVWIGVVSNAALQSQAGVMSSGGYIDLQNVVTSPMAFRSLAGTTAPNVFQFNATPADTSENLLQLQKSGTAVLTVSNDGSMLLGTNAPINSSQLSISGNNNLLSLQANGPAWPVNFSETNSSVFSITEANGTISMNAAGNVGIGTMFPSGTFDVEGGTNASGAGSNISLVAQSAGSGNNKGGDINLNPGSKSGSGARGSVNIGNNANLVLNPDAVLGWGMNNAFIQGSNGYIKLSTTGNNDLWVDAAGNVGIGTNAPGASLDINGSLRLDGSSSGYVGFKAPASIANPVIWQLPSGDASVAGQMLTSDASGNLYWSTVSGGGGASIDWTSPGTIGSTTPNTGAFTTLTTTGSVGIGTTSTTDKVNIEQVLDGGILALRVKNTSIAAGNTEASLFVDNGTSFGQLFKTGTGYSTYRSIGANDLGFYNNGGNISVLNDSGGGNINFTTGGRSTPSLAVASDGKVGVGTTSPSGALDVEGGGGGSVDLLVSGRIQTGDGGHAGGIYLDGTAHNLFIGNNPNVNGSQGIGMYINGAWQFNLDQNGNLGIGTTTPSSPLQVIGTTTSTVFEATSAGSVANPTFALPDGNSGIYQAASGAVNITAGGINSLQVTQSQSSMYTPLLLNNNANNVQTALAVSSTGSGYTATFSGGNVGIGNTSPSYPLDVTGDIRTSACLRYASSTIGTCSSDERLKKDIAPYTLGLKEILGIEPVTFKYNGLGGNTDDGREQIGVIAQQVEKVVPQIVGIKEIKLHSNDTTTIRTKTVDYGAFTYMIINAIKSIYKSMMGIESQLSAQDRAIASVKADSDAKTAVLQAENKKLKQENAAIKAYLCNKDPEASLCR